MTTVHQRVQPDVGQHIGRHRDDSDQDHKHNHNYGPSYEGAVVLDIGGDIGALIIFTEPGEAGREIEVSPIDDDTRTHVAVRERQLAGSTVYCAVYPRLTAGRYTIWRDQATPVADVRIHGAEVAHFTWRR
jgi:hypothetical protein